MNTYLLSVGWWNLIGSFLMLGFLNTVFANKVLVTWTGIFKKELTSNYYTKLFIGWAVGLNIIFALINIMAAKWNFIELKSFMIWVDIISYILFIGLTFWGIITKNCSSGIYVAILIFGVWIGWGLSVI